MESRRLLTARVESQLLQQDARELGLGGEPFVVLTKDGDELIERRVARARRSEGHIGGGVQLLVEDEEHEVALVLGIVEERAQADVRPLGDLPHRGGAVAVAREELARRGADALARSELFLLPGAYLVSSHIVSAEAGHLWLGAACARSSRRGNRASPRRAAGDGAYE